MSIEELIEAITVEITNIGTDETEYPLSIFINTTRIEALEWVLGLMK